MNDFVRLALCAPKTVVGDVEKNTQEILNAFLAAAKNEVAVFCAPELSLSGYSCGDLFQSATLLDAVEQGLGVLAKGTKGKTTVLIVGAPIRFRDRCLNTAVVIYDGIIAGIVPKSFIPNYKEFYEKRWFSSGANLKNHQVSLMNINVPLGSDLLFEVDGSFRFGVEICEDLWVANPPSTKLCQAGAELIFNLSASNEVIGKSEYRRTLVKSQSSRLLCIYAYVSAGPTESSTDLVFSGHRLVAENGEILVNATSQDLRSAVSVADVDIFKVSQLRRIESSFSEAEVGDFRLIALGAVNKIKKLHRKIERNPFVPVGELERSKRCEDVLNLQALALAQRCSHLKCKALVLGLSGGLDSTMALLVCSTAQKYLEIKVPILAVSLPGFATSTTTMQNARLLAKSLDLDFKEIDIKPSCSLHLKDIGHDLKSQDVTYENAQARERTQILMDVANKVQGIVVGTGDLSEIALGWSTFNGDHMSMYSVNCGVPKTLIREVISWYARQIAEKELAEALVAVLSTPISPELTSSGGQGIEQRTEDILGPYEVHDFFLYHFLRFGSGAKRIIRLAVMAFEGSYNEDQLRGWLKLFIKRFFANQFKRNCIPDGPKIGTISLSPRGDWRMPSDASADEWLKEI